VSKGWEYWIALATGLLIVIERHKQARFSSRVLIAMISGGFGHVSAPEVASLTGRSEALSVMVLTGLGYLLIDLAAGIIADRKTIVDLARSFLGGRK